MKSQQGCESMGRSASYRMSRLQAALSCVDVLRGNDPISAIVGAVIAVIGIVLVVVGAAVDSPALIGFGIITILGGVCIAAGLCSLVVAVLIPVAA